MRLLIDTHLLLWAAEGSRKLSKTARALIADPGNERVFSAVSLWEIAIKSAPGRRDFQVDATELRSGLLENNYSELAISGAHAILTSSLPPIHKDPFDRILIAQAMIEGMTLLTADPIVAKYNGPVRGV